MINPEILVIDDHIETANTYADLIEKKCSLPTKAVTKQKDAIDFVTNYPIKIIVIDQMMPKLGTEIFENLKKINPWLKAIMISGESTLKYVQKARNLGYSDFLHKGDVEKLPEYVFKIYAEYELDLVKRSTISEQKLLYRERKGFLGLNKVEYYILEYQIVNNEYVFEDSWKIEHKIDRGEKTTIEIERTVEQNLKITNEIQNQLGTEFSLKPSALDTLKLKLKNNLKLTSGSTEETMEKEVFRKKIELSIDGEVIDGQQVMSRNYETAQVYHQIFIQIRKRCSCCNIEKLTPIVVYNPVNKLAFRHVNFTVEKEEIVNTGVINLN